MTARKSVPWHRIRESATITAGALANDTTVVAASPAMTQSGAIVKTEYLSLKANAFTAGESNPLLIGIADGQLTAAEIAECLGVDGPTFHGEDPSEHRADRHVRVLAQISVEQGNGPAMLIQNGDALLLGVDIKMGFTEEKAWQWFLHNISGATLTTGGTVRIFAGHLIRWSA